MAIGPAGSKGATGAAVPLARQVRQVRQQVRQVLKVTRATGAEGPAALSARQVPAGPAGPQGPKGEDGLNGSHRHGRRQRRIRAEDEGCPLPGPDPTTLPTGCSPSRAASPPRTAAFRRSDNGHGWTVTQSGNTNSCTCRLLRGVARRLALRQGPGAEIPGPRCDKEAARSGTRWVVRPRSLSFHSDSERVPSWPWPCACVDLLTAAPTTQP